MIIELDNILNKLGLYQKFTELIGYLDDFQQYTTEFNKYLSGVYFILGKPLVIYLITVFICIVAVRVIFAIINIVGRFVP